MTRAGGDVVDAYLFHHLLKVLTVVTWAIVCDNRLGYTLFTEYCFHVFSDMSCCHGLEHADNWKAAHVVYDEQITFIVNYEYVRGQFCPRHCWDFMASDAPMLLESLQLAGEYFKQIVQLEMSVFSSS